MLGPLATGLHTGGGLHLELKQQRPHHAGAGYKQRAGEPRQFSVPYIQYPAPPADVVAGGAVSSDQYITRL